MCLLRINLPNLCPNMNNFDAVDFSECHSEEVISFFGRSVYNVQVVDHFLSSQHMSSGGHFENEHHKSQFMVFACEEHLCGEFSSLFPISMGPFIYRYMYVLGTRPRQNVLETSSRYTSVQIASTVKCSRYPFVQI